MGTYLFVYFAEKVFFTNVAFMAEFNKMASVINGLATNFEMEKEECM